MADTIDIIIVGCAGGRGSWFTRELAAHPGYRITGLVDTLTQGAAVVAGEYGLEGVPIHAAIEPALAQVRCDAVLVATPDAEHTVPVLQSLEAGKHVYAEKPLAISLSDCLRIIEADEKAGGRTMVGFNLRSAPFYRTMHGLLHEGRIGRPLTLQADEFYYGGRTYFRRWNRLKSVGGGLWITKACHDLDLLYWMANRLPLRVRASASLSHYKHRSEAGARCSECAIEADCPDSNLAQLAQQPEFRRRIHDIRERAGLPPTDMCLYNSDKDTFDHGVAVVDFEDELTAVYTLNVVASHTERRMRIGGTEGMIEGSLNRPEVLLWRRHADPAEPQVIPASSGDVRGGHGGGDARLLDNFASFVRGETSARIAPAEASVAVALGLAATVASETGAPVAMESVEGWGDLARSMQ